MLNQKTVKFKFFIILMIIIFPLSLLAQDCAESQILGEQAAESQHSGVGWFVGGLFSGALLGLIGTGITFGIAAGSTPKPDIIPENVNSACYVNGYSKKAKSSNKWSAFGGGLLGTAIIVTVLLTTSSNSSN